MDSKIRAGRLGVRPLRTPVGAGHRAGPGKDLGKERSHTAIPDSFIEELVARSDIVDVVSDYVQLSKRSGANLFGLCPFHSEKTPSFSVRQDKQTYHCFGCGKGGGVINFIMEIENLSYRDAIEFLARRAGMQMPAESDEERQLRGRRAKLLELNRAAAMWFFENLSKPEGAAALEYIRERRLLPKTVKRFGLGAAPNSWESLVDEMRRRGYADQDLIDAGLAKRGKSGGIYDSFRNRLIFPVIDVRGSVIGFSGRILNGEEPKYLNTSDTMVFQKSRNLFALNLAKKTKRDMLILVEGNVDVVMLHQAGFDCAVASLGTSLTPEQARLMKQYKDTVVIAYDSDGAGVKAAQRAIGLLEPAGLQVRVLRMEGAKDPDEFIKAKGPEAFELLLERSANHVEYRILAAKAKYDMDTDDGRLGFLREATQILAENPSPVERELYAGRVAEMIGVSADAVKSEVRREGRYRAAAEKKKRERAVMRPEVSAQPVSKSIRYENVASATAEEGVVSLLMADPQLVIFTGELTPEEFTSPFLGRVFAKIKERWNAGAAITPAVIASGLEPDEASHLTGMLQRPVNLGQAREAMADYIDKIKTEKLKESGQRDLLAVREKYQKKKGLGG